MGAGGNIAPKYTKVVYMNHQVTNNDNIQFENWQNLFRNTKLNNGVNEIPVEKRHTTIHDDIDEDDDDASEIGCNLFAFFLNYCHRLMIAQKHMFLLFLIDVDKQKQLTADKEALYLNFFQRLENQHHIKSDGLLCFLFCMLLEPGAFFQAVSSINTKSHSFLFQIWHTPAQNTTKQSMIYFNIIN